VEVGPSLTDEKRLSLSRLVAQRRRKIYAHISMVEERGIINGKVLVQLRSYSLSRYSSFYTNFRFYYVAMFSYITAMQPQNTICLRQTMVLIPNFSRPCYHFQKEFHRNVWSVFFKIQGHLKSAANSMPVWGASADLVQMSKDTSTFSAERLYNR